MHISAENKYTLYIACSVCMEGTEGMDTRYIYTHTYRQRETSMHFHQCIQMLIREGKKQKTLWAAYHSTILGPKNTTSSVWLTSSRKTHHNKDSTL